MDILSTFISSITLFNMLSHLYPQMWRGSIDTSVDTLDTHDHQLKNYLFTHLS